MATTVGDILRASLRKVKVLAAGEPLPATDGQDAKEVFELMVDDWTTEQLLIPVVSNVTGTLIEGQGSYTIGIWPSGTAPATHFETARPEEILAAFIRDSSGTDYIQEIIDVETYSRISRKTNSSRPSRFYVQKGWPLNTINFESLPYEADVLHLTVLQPLAGILPTANLTDIINLPPGYKQALIYNLCILLADEWGKTVTPSIATTAIEGKKRIKRANWRKIVLGMDRAVATQRKGISTYIIEQGP